MQAPHDRRTPALVHHTSMMNRDRLVVTTQSRRRAVQSPPDQSSLQPVHPPCTCSPKQRLQLRCDRSALQLFSAIVTIIAGRCCQPAAPPPCQTALPALAPQQPQQPMPLAAADMKHSHHRPLLPASCAATRSNCSASASPSAAASPPMPRASAAQRSARSASAAACWERPRKRLG